MNTDHINLPTPLVDAGDAMHDALGEAIDRGNQSRETVNKLRELQDRWMAERSALSLEAQVQGSSGQEGEGSGRSGAQGSAVATSAASPRAEERSGLSAPIANAPTHDAIAAKAAKWDELAEAVGKFYEGDEPTGDLMDIGELCAIKLGYL